MSPLLELMEKLAEVQALLDNVVAAANDLADQAQETSNAAEELAAMEGSGDAGDAWGGNEGARTPVWDPNGSPTVPAPGNNSFANSTTNSMGNGNRTNTPAPFRQLFGESAASPPSIQDAAHRLELHPGFENLTEEQQEFVRSCVWELEMPVALMLHYFVLRFAHVWVLEEDGRANWWGWWEDIWIQHIKDYYRQCAIW